jgi:hypothetical protein
MELSLRHDLNGLTATPVAEDIPFDPEQFRWGTSKVSELDKAKLEQVVCFLIARQWNEAAEQSRLRMRPFRKALRK